MRSPLDGPGMGYGPGAGSDRRGVPLVTVVLALACLALAVALAAVLLRPTATTAGPAGTTTTAPAGTTAPTPTQTTAGSPTPAPPTVGATASPSVTPSGTDATERPGEPPGVRDTVTAFLRAWLEPRAEVRVPALQVVATASLTEQLADVDPANLPKAKPAGAAKVTSASDYAAVADQSMSDRSTVRMELVYDPASRYGWLVDTVSPLE